jgi:hypothetical protein
VQDLRKCAAELTVNLSDLQAQMGRLGETSVIGGERTDAIDHLVAGIARLGSEVSDASGYLPPYDQRTYGEVLKPFTPCHAAQSPIADHASQGN